MAVKVRYWKRAKNSLHRAVTSPSKMDGRRTMLNIKELRERKKKLEKRSKELDNEVSKCIKRNFKGIKNGLKDYKNMLLASSFKKIYLIPIERLSSAYDSYEQSIHEDLRLAIFPSHQGISELENIEDRFKLAYSFYHRPTGGLVRSLLTWFGCSPSSLRSM
jgi:hypothetical protein